MGAGGVTDFRGHWVKFIFIGLDFGDPSVTF